MKCPHCGAENPDNGVFCQQCDKWILASVYAGAITPKEPEPEAKPATKKNNRKIVLTTLAAMCIVLLAIALLLPGPNQPGLITTGKYPGNTYGTMPPPYVPASGTVLCQSYIDSTRMNGKLAFIADQQLIQTQYTVGVGKLSSSLDGKTGVCLTEDDILLYIRDGVVTEVGKDVKSFALSASGDGLAFLTNGGALYLFRADVGSATVIFDDSLATILHYAISPDGNTVYFYTQDRRIATGYQYSACMLLRYQGGTVSALNTQDSIIGILAVADGGQWAYVLSGNKLLIVDENGSITDLGKYVILRDPTAPPYTSYSYPLPSLHFSADSRQLLYYLEDGSYLSTDGKPGVKVSDDHLTPVTPALTKTITREYVATYPYYTLTDKLYTSLVISTNPAVSITSALFFYRTVHYLNNALQCQKLLENLNTLWLDPTGEDLFYCNSEGILSRMEGRDVKNAKAISTTDGKFVVSPDCSTVYFLSQGTLFRHTDQGIAIVCDHQNADIKLYMTAENVFCYELDGALHYENNVPFADIVDCHQADNGTVYFEFVGGGLGLLKGQFLSLILTNPE